MALTDPQAPHIIHVAPGEVFGGAERQILTLLQHLHDKAAKLGLVLFHDTEMAARARESGIHVEILGVKGLVDFQALNQLKNIFSSDEPGIVHVHGYRAAAYTALAKRRHKFATVKTEHGAPEAHGALLRDWRPRLYRKIENQASLHLAAEMVYVTKELRHRCAEEHARLKQHVIYNGVNEIPAHSLAPPKELQPGYRHLVLVGRLEPVKGIETAVEAMASLAASLNVRLHVIGAGPEQRPLEELIKKLGAADRVQLLGFRQNVYDYIAHADALLIPSLHEGLPYTLLEALSLRTPVIASKVGGLAEVLEDKRTALLVPPKAPGALSSAIQLLLSSPDLAAELRASGKDLIDQHFSAKAMGESYLRLYQGILK